MALPPNADFWIAFSIVIVIIVIIITFKCAPRDKYNNICFKKNNEPFFCPKEYHNFCQVHNKKEVLSGFEISSCNSFDEVRKKHNMKSDKNNMI